MNNCGILTAFGSAILLFVSCSPEQDQVPPGDPEILEITEADIGFRIEAGFSDEQARAVLEMEAKGVRAALEAGIGMDPGTRAEIARLLIKRHREIALQPKMKAALATLTDERLREIYDQNIARFQKPERRQVAVLWLDPGQDPARKEAYLEKLQKARAWHLENAELAAGADEGFSVLSIDHSQHAPSRYQGGVIGWIQKEASDPWSKAVAEIAFQSSDLSEVVDRPEGLFLVKVMKTETARMQVFETVRKSLRNQEAARIRKEIEVEFEESLR